MIASRTRLVAGLGVIALLVSACASRPGGSGAASSVARPGPNRASTPERAALGFYRDLSKMPHGVSPERMHFACLSQEFGWFAYDGLMERGLRATVVRHGSSLTASIVNRGGDEVRARYRVHSDSGGYCVERVLNTDPPASVKGLLPSPTN